MNNQNLNDEIVTAVAFGCPNLIFLELGSHYDNIFSVTDESIDDITKWCKKLVHLCLTGLSQISVEMCYCIIYRLPYLKLLNLEHGPELNQIQKEDLVRRSYNSIKLIA